MKRIRFGQIGVCHEHAEGIIKSLRNLPDVFEIVGIVDDRNSLAAKFAGNNLAPYDGLQWLSEEELFNTPGLQAVAVETPNSDLVPTAIRCMENNLHIHMDKPAGEEIELFGKLLNGCKERTLTFQMGYMFRNNSAMQFCLKAIRSNWLGDVFEVQAGMSHNYGGEPYQQYIAHFQGGIMFNLGCHFIDLIIGMLGRPEDITPFLKSTPEVPNETRNTCLTILEYPHATVTLRACSREVDGLQHRRLKVCGTKGTVDLSPLERFDGEPLEMRLTILEDNEEYNAGTHIVKFAGRKDRYRDQLLELADIINGKMKNPYTYGHDYLVQQTVLAAAGYTKWSK